MAAAGVGMLRSAYDSRRTAPPQQRATQSRHVLPSSVRRFCLPFGIDCTMNDEEQTLSNLLRNPWNFMKFCPQFDGAQLRVLLVAKWFGCKYHFDRYLKLPKDKLDFLVIHENECYFVPSSLIWCYKSYSFYAFLQVAKADSTIMVHTCPTTWTLRIKFSRQHSLNN